MRSTTRKTLVTMGDVAARAAVSQTTVSYVLNDRTAGVNIPSDTRQRVMDAARELGYRRNQLARAMVTGKSRILGVFTAPADAEVSLRILAGAMESANQNDYLLKVMHIHYYGLDQATIARCAEWQIAGAMMVGLGEENQVRLSNELGEKGLPLVMVDNVPASATGVCILSDDRQGIGMVMAHLLALGHRRIAFLGGRPCALSDRRERIFREEAATAELEIPDHWIRNTSWGDQAIIEAGAHAILAHGSSRPTAVVCSGDAIAMIVLRIAQSLGLEVPKDLSVTGYSNVDLGAFATTPLTTVDQRFQEMGRAATQHLVDADQKIDAEAPATYLRSEILLPVRLVERSSTGPPPT